TASRATGTPADARKTKTPREPGATPAKTARRGRRPPGGRPGPCRRPCEQTRAKRPRAPLIAGAAAFFFTVGPGIACPSRAYGAVRRRGHGGGAGAGGGREGAGGRGAAGRLGRAGVSARKAQTSVSAAA